MTTFPSNPCRLGPTLPRRNTKIGSATPKFAHIEKVGNSRRVSWTRLMPIRGQYNDYNDLHRCCTDFVLHLAARRAAPEPIAYSPLIRTQKWVMYKRGSLRPSLRPRRHLPPVTCSGVTAARPGHVNLWEMGLHRMQGFGIRDSGSPLGKEVTSLPVLLARVGPSSPPCLAACA
jgi:hypothetical protein